MFRNKVLVRAIPSSAPPPPFLLRQVSFSAAAPSLDLDILCCRLSRSHRLACLPQPPTDALVIYQRCQSRAADEVVSKIAAAFPIASVGEEEEVVCSGSLVAKAIECGLRCLMLEHGWSFVGESIYVETMFAASEERTDLCALNVEVRSGPNDHFDFIVSPDAFRFTAHKISDIASSSMMETFEHSKEVSLDGCNLQTACAILPTLKECHVIAFSKSLPPGHSLDKFIEFCSIKHGLETNYSYHAAVKLTHGDSWEKQWLPSSFILQGSALQPALKSVRALKAMSSLRSFIEFLKAWNFFGQHQLVIKEQLILNCATTLPSWKKAITVHTARADYSEDFGLSRPHLKEKLLTLDFRTPKPAVFCSLSAKLGNTKVDEKALSSDDDGTGNGKAHVALLKPSFSRPKRADTNNTRHFSVESSDADSLNKLSDTSLPKSSLRCFTKATHANPVNSSSASNIKQVIQEVQEGHQGGDHARNFKASEYLKRKHAEFLGNSGEGGNVKDYIPDVLQETRSMPDIQEDFLSTKAIQPKSKSMGCKGKMTATTKLKRKPEVVTNEFNKKIEFLQVVDHQKDEFSKKITRVKVKAKDELTSTRTKARLDVDKDELMAKVIDHHKRGELHLLTVAELKGFLSTKKAKVGGSKEVLIQRASELLS
ncbi:uncharacterized protein LOC100841852 isoform X4 [Brachypodium distachyon]|uniref:SAP domain-containing protein n=1 Tax=Brachypodium distachyon TaxID=15368 RepID=A0A2K2CZ09_BRADI|nr:uncharacterized protein LOC100841852 isoform X4 [Brachypodium distachyon]PNT67264.1 hypothetical protein BRADI_3g23105v3 [Brachypodium distachyon]|eukprot:XP_010234676.1 uncharacterized protein LOC100841852 isoform X4 [Brachypodium distachyon]